MEHSSSSVTILFLRLLTVVTAVIRFSDGLSSTGCIERERRSLLRFRQDIIDPANLLASWTGYGDCCLWAGVVCDNITGHVRELRLGNPYFTDYWISDKYLCYKRSQLGGKLNSCLLNLEHLNYLDLSNNNFQRMQIPSFLGSMQSLKYLNLSQAGFSRIIPYQLGNLSNLLYLDLHVHPLAWGLNVENLQWLSGLSSLKHLDLSNVDLSKASDWLDVTTVLPSLSVLYLSGCDLRYLPSVSNLNFSSLNNLDLSNNLFDNSFVPSWLFELTNLVSLNLGYNSFQGPIPDGLQNMTNLINLGLSGNHFNSSIPDWFYGFSHLQFLNLGLNNFEGSISNSIGNLSSAISIDISYNKFEGGIPTSLGKLCNLKAIDLSAVPLTQDISSILQIFSEGCTSKRLESLLLMYSQLFGHLTNQLGHLKNLVRLDLSGNSISGPLPDSLGDLSFLTSLLLSSNKINGSLPTYLGQLANLEELSISNNLFEGVVSEAHFSKLRRLKDFDASGNQLMLSVSPDWIPPFQLETIGLASWYLGPQFPPWLQTQKFHNLDISDTKISDTIPSWFWNMSYQYAHINLSHNEIRGTIPNLTWFASSFVSNIINLSSNNFEGPVPCISPTVSESRLPGPFISGVIDLSANYFQGPVPCISPIISVLDLSNNSLSGSISPFLCDRMSESRLQVLNLRDNLLSGEIPDCWMEWSVVGINLSNNRFTGEIPSSIGNLTLLQSLHLRNNSLSGRIPASLQNCTNLVTLDLAENHFAGSIPKWMGERLSKMKIVILRSNKFDALIPEELCSLAFLQALDLAHNELRGSIPKCVHNFSAMTTRRNSSENYIAYNPFGGVFNDNALLVSKGMMLDYGNILNIVRILDLSSNNLSGEIPEEVTDLIALQILNFSHNHFSGSIPKNIGAMGSLESLDLSINQLVGEIPPSIANLSFLSHLNLSYNHLTGKIPSGTQLQTFDASSFLGNKLCGPPLDQKCTVLPQPEGGDSEERQAQEEVMGFYVSMAFGFVLSFWMVIGFLVINRRWRQLYFQFFDNMRYTGFARCILLFCLARS